MWIKAFEEKWAIWLVVIGACSCSESKCKTFVCSLLLVLTTVPVSENDVWGAGDAVGLWRAVVRSSMAVLSLCPQLLRAHTEVSLQCCQSEASYDEVKRSTRGWEILCVASTAGWGMRSQNGSLRKAGCVCTHSRACRNSALGPVACLSGEPGHHSLTALFALKQSLRHKWLTVRCWNHAGLV